MRIDGCSYILSYNAMLHIQDRALREHRSWEYGWINDDKDSMEEDSY